LLEDRFHRILEKQLKLDQGVEFEEFVLDDLDIAYEEGADQLKLEAVKDILADLPDGEPLLVWTHSAKWARMAEKKLGSQAVAWTSGTTAARREKIKDGFGTQWRVLIAQLQSLSTGVDWLKHACRCEVIASCTEDEVMNQQAEGRLHRPGQKSPVQRWRLVTEGTIDDDVNLNNLEKRARMGSIYQDNVKREAA
jgi:superfamily II DNA or RNA helicase